MKTASLAIRGSGFLLAVFVLPGFCNVSASSGFGSDVVVGLDVEPSNVVRPDSTGVLHVSVTNRGEVAVEPTMSLSKQLGGVNYHVTFSPDEGAAPCTYAAFVLDGLPGNPSSGGISLWPGALGPGDSVTCSVRFRVGPEASGSVQVRASVLPGSLEGIDPDYSNNVIRTSIIVRSPVPTASNGPTPIPFGGAAGIFGLAFSVALAGGLWLRRR